MKSIKVQDQLFVDDSTLPTSPTPRERENEEEKEMEITSVPTTNRIPATAADKNQAIIYFKSATIIQKVIRGRNGRRVVKKVCGNCYEFLFNHYFF